MRLHLTAPLAACLLAASTLTPVAFAQTSPPAAPPPAAAPAAPAPAAPAPAAPAPAAPAAAAPQTMRHPRATRRTRAAQPTMASRVEARIDELHRQLAITTAQEGQWNQFAQVMRDNATAMDQALTDRGGQLGTMNAAETLQSYAALAELHAQNVQKLVTAFQPLYAALSDTQKHAADVAFRPPAPRRTARH